MRVLVVGGAGFIGSHVVDALVARRDDVVVLDDLRTGFRKNLAHHGSRVRFVDGDMLDRSKVDDAIRGADAVVLLASLRSVPASMKDPFSFYRVNGLGTQTVLMAAEAAGVRRLVFASSSSVYGTNDKFPSREGDEGLQLSHYALTKLCAERQCWLASHYGRLDTVSLRFFNVFGARQNPTGQYATVIPIFIDKLLSSQQPVIYGDGEQAKDFTHVSNVVSGILLALDRAEPFHGEVVNLANGTPTSVNELFAKISGMLGLRDVKPVYGPPRDGDVRRSMADTAKLFRLLGYSPVRSFDDGLRETIAWYRENSGYFGGV